jgi:hypothetical protein
MQIGPVIALYFLKEREVVDLIALLQMKRFNQPVDQEVLLVPQMLAA